MTGDQKRKLRALTLSEKKKYDRGKTAQESLPFEWIDRNGLMKMSDGKYSVCLSFGDRTFEGLSEAERKAVSEGWEALLNSFGRNLSYEFTYTFLPERAEKAAVPEGGSKAPDLLAAYGEIANGALESENGGLKRHMYLTVSGSFRGRDEAYEKLSAAANDAAEGMHKAGTEATVMTGPERCAAISGITRQDEPDRAISDYLLLSEGGLTAGDLCAPSSFGFGEARLMRTGSVFGEAGFVRIDSGSLLMSDFGSLLKLEIPRAVSLHLVPVDQTAALKIIKRKVSDLDSMAIDEEKKAVRSGYDMERIPRDLNSYGRDAMEMLERLQTKGEKLFDASVVMTVFGNDSDNVRKNVSKAGALLGSIGCAFCPFDYRQEEGFMACLPAGVCGMQIERSLTTHSLSAFIPFLSKRIRHRTPGSIFCGTNRYTGETVSVNRSDLLNPNGLVLGTPGAGKSFFAKWEMISAFLCDPDSDVIICDPESEYHEAVRAMGGEVIKIAPGSDSHINPMEINTFGNISEEVILKGDFIQSVFEIIMGDEPVTAGERSVLNRAVGRVYERFEKDGSSPMPTLRDLREELLRDERNEGVRLASALEIYTDGTLNIFSHESNVDTENRIIDFDIKDLGTGLKSLGMLIVENEIWGRIVRNRKAGRRTRCYIDEMHLLLATPETAAFTASVWKRARKYGGIPTGITQNVKDLLTSNEASAIIENSNCIVMLRQAPGDREILRERLRLSERMTSELTTAGEGEGIIKCENDFIPFRNVIPRDSLLYRVMTTKPGEGMIS